MLRMREIAVCTAGDPEVYVTAILGDAFSSPRS